jgi:hypothetical protein
MNILKHQDHINLRNLVSGRWLERSIAQGADVVFSEFHELTPDVAAELLNRNSGNRLINQAKLSGYTADVAAGNWAENGEPIIISKCGQLNDGQHRCLAVVAAGKSIVTNFVFGVERETRTTVDQGFGRTVGGRLHMAGVPNANQAAAVAGYLWQYDKYGLITKQTHRRPTQAQVEEKYAECGKLINDAISIARRKGVEDIGKVGLVGFCHCVFARINKGRSDEFIGRLIDGVGLSAESPIYICRQRLLGMKVAATEVRAEVIFRGWLAFVNKRKITKIQIASKDERTMSKLPEV